MGEYAEHIRSYDHNHIRLTYAEEYHRLREVLSEFANAVPFTTLAGLLDVVRDATVTAPNGDCCRKCGTYDLTWPYRVNRDGTWLRTRYRCARGHEWGRGFSVDYAEFD